MRNSFAQLREMEMAEFVENRQDAVRANVESRLRTTEFFASVLELFFPKMADTLTVMMGGDAIEGKDDYPTVSDNGAAGRRGGAIIRLEGPLNRDETSR